MHVHIMGHSFSYGENKKNKQTTMSCQISVCAAQHNSLQKRIAVML